MKYSALHLVWIALLGATLGGCQSEDSDAVDPNRALFEEQQQTITDFLEAQDIATQQTTSGIHYRVLTENATGAIPEPGNIVNLYYRLEELEGSVIDVRENSPGVAPVTYTFGFSSSDPRVHHLIFPIGLDAMINSMREGEEYEFFLPSRYAYLDYELGDTLSPNAIVRAQIHLSEVLTVEEQRHAEDAKIKSYLIEQNLENADSLASGVYYLRTKEGDGVEVDKGNRVKVRYTGQLLNGVTFDSNETADRELLEFTVAPNEAISGFLTGIEQMRLGEKGTIVMPSHTAYGQGLIAIPYTFVSNYLNTVILNPRDYGFARRIPPYSPLRFDIEVVEVN